MNFKVIWDTVCFNNFFLLLLNLPCYQFVKVAQSANEVTSNTAGFKSKREAKRKENFWGSGNQSNVFQAGGKAKRPLGKVNQNKISNSIHVPTAKVICSLPFFRMEIQRSPEPARTKTKRKAQTRGGLGTWVKSFKLEKEMVHG